MHQWENLLVGLTKQLGYPSVWILLIAGALVCAAIGLYLVRHRGWPPVPTTVALSWTVLFVSLTWRHTSSETAEHLSLWGHDSYLGVLFSADGWSITASQLAAGGPYVVANTLFLLPLGAFLYVASRRVWLTTVVCVLLVTTVEVQQSLLVTTDEVTDFATNVAGAMVGVAIGWSYVQLRRRLNPRQDHVDLGDVGPEMSESSPGSS